MPGRKGSGEKPSSPRVHATTTAAEPGLPPPAPQRKPAGKWVKRGTPPLAGTSKPARHSTIEVNSRWLIPSIPEIAIPKRSEPPRQPLPLPATLAVKPRGKLPPPLPREDRESAPTDPPKRGERTSKRPPRAR
jgi:hypothetical protein